MHAAWTKAWSPHAWCEGGEADFRADLAEFFGIATDTRHGRKNQNLIIDRLATMDRPPEVLPFLLGYSGSDNLSRWERMQIIRVLMRANLRADFRDLVTVEDLHSGPSA